MLGFARFWSDTEKIFWKISWKHGHLVKTSASRACPKINLKEKTEALQIRKPRATISIANSWFHILFNSHTRTQQVNISWELFMRLKHLKAKTTKETRDHSLQPHKSRKNTARMRATISGLVPNVLKFG